MEFTRLGLELGVEAPKSVGTRDFVPVFHSWIQGQLVPDHLLIDVHDYSHVAGGPGVLLVAHEGNFSLELERSASFAYFRKRPFQGSNQEYLGAIFRTLLEAAKLLRERQVKIKTDRFRITINDRLNAPNRETTLQQAIAPLSEFLEGLLGNRDFSVEHLDDPKERFAVDIRSRAPALELSTLLSRLEGPMRSQPPPRAASSEPLLAELINARGTGPVERKRNADSTDLPRQGTRQRHE